MQFLHVNYMYYIMLHKYTRRLKFEKILFVSVEGISHL